MPQITYTQLERLMRTVKAPTPIAFTALTTPKMRRRQNPFLCPCCREPVVQKRARVSAFLRASYTGSVNRQRAREGNPRYFTSVGRTWGNREIMTPLIQYRGELYLNLKRERLLDVEYLILGEPASGEQLEQVESLLIQPASESNRQELKKQIVTRDYRLDRVRRLSMKSHEYTIRPRRRRPTA